MEPPLVWTKEVPTAEGFYWWRTDDWLDCRRKRVEALRVIFSSASMRWYCHSTSGTVGPLDLLKGTYPTSEFAGPILPPS